MVVRRGSRSLRSEEKDEFRGRVWVGTRDSFSMVARTPRCEGDETSVLKASMSSWEAGRVR